MTLVERAEAASGISVKGGIGYRHLIVTSGDPLVYSAAHGVASSDYPQGELYPQCRLPTVRFAHLGNRYWGLLRVQPSAETPPQLSRYTPRRKHYVNFVLLSNPSTRGEYIKRPETTPLYKTTHTTNHLTKLHLAVSQSRASAELYKFSW